MNWRVIMTDSESLTGVAPVCESTHGDDGADYWVYDCCPGPHIECWLETVAAEVANDLTNADAELCS